MPNDSAGSEPLIPCDGFGAHVRVAALLHSPSAAPDQLGAFRAERAESFGMRDLSVYVSDFEQRSLMPVVGSAGECSLDMVRRSEKFSGTLFDVATDVLVAGDRLFCITDGVTDAHPPGGEDFEDERLVALLETHSRGHLDAAETVRQLSHSVLDHHGYLSDDTIAFLVDFH